MVAEYISGHKQSALDLDLGNKSILVLSFHEETVAVARARPIAEMRKSPLLAGFHFFIGVVDVHSRREMRSFALVNAKSAKHAVLSTRLAMNLESVVLWLKFHLCLSYALFSDVPNIVIDHVSSRVPAILICLVRKSNQKHHSSPHFPHRL